MCFSNCYLDYHFQHQEKGADKGNRGADVKGIVGVLSLGKERDGGVRVVLKILDSMSEDWVSDEEEDKMASIHMAGGHLWRFQDSTANVSHISEEATFIKMKAARLCQFQGCL